MLLEAVFTSLLQIEPGRQGGLGALGFGFSILSISQPLDTNMTVPDLPPATSTNTI